mgnify:CR=1 FL=1
MQNNRNSVKLLFSLFVTIGLSGFSTNSLAGGVTALPACADLTRCGNVWLQDATTKRLEPSPAKVLNAYDTMHNWASVLPFLPSINNQANVPRSTHGAAVCRVSYTGSQFIGILRATNDNKPTCVFVDASGSQVLYSHILQLPVRVLWMTRYNNSTPRSDGVIPISHKFIPYLRYTVNLSDVENTDENFVNAWYATRIYGGAIPFLAGKRSSGSKIGVCTALDNNTRYLGSLDESGNCAYVTTNVVNNIATDVAKVGRAETFLAIYIPADGPSQPQPTITKPCTSTSC